MVGGIIVFGVVWGTLILVIGWYTVEGIIENIRSTRHWKALSKEEKEKERARLRETAMRLAKERAARDRQKDIEVEYRKRMMKIDVPMGEWPSPGGFLARSGSKRYHDQRLYVEKYNKQLLKDIVWEFEQKDCKRL